MQVLAIVKKTGNLPLKMKKSNVRHVWLSVLIAAVLFMMLLSLLMHLKKPEGFVLDGTWKLESEGQSREITLPYFEPVAPEGQYTYSKEFGIVEADALVIPQISAYGYTIKLNDRIIEKVNDPSNKTANIWNQTQLIVFDPKLL